MCPLGPPEILQWFIRSTQNATSTERGPSLGGHGHIEDCLYPIRVVWVYKMWGPPEKLAAWRHVRNEHRALATSGLCHGRIKTSYNRSVSFGPTRNIDSSSDRTSV